MPLTFTWILRTYSLLSLLLTSPTLKAGIQPPAGSLPYRRRAAVNGITYSTLSLPYEAFLCPFPLSSRSARSVAQAAFSAPRSATRNAPRPDRPIARNRSVVVTVAQCQLYGTERRSGVIIGGTVFWSREECHMGESTVLKRDLLTEAEGLVASGAPGGAGGGGGGGAG